MLSRVVESIEKTSVSRVCVVLGSNLNAFESFLKKNGAITICVQQEANGTAGAVGTAAFGFAQTEAPPYVKGRLERGDLLTEEFVLICAGDMPNVDDAVLEEFIESSLARNVDLAVLGMRVPDPTGYGRLMLDSRQRLKKIVEESEATDTEKKEQLVNTGVFFARRQELFQLLAQLDNRNRQGEYFLTDCVEKAEAGSVYVHETENWQSFLGVNTKKQLLDIEAPF